MSGIIKKIKNHKRKIFVIVVFAIGCFCLLLRLYVVGIILIVFDFLNEAVQWKMRKERAPFDSYSRIRNVDYLVIGDICNINDIVPEKNSYVQITAPQRSITASYEILRHTFSILKEYGGIAVIVDAQKKNDYTTFDIPYFHEVTIERLRLEKPVKLRYFPILTNPIKSIKYLFAKGKKVFQCDCENWEIINL